MWHGLRLPTENEEHNLGAMLVTLGPPNQDKQPLPIKSLGDGLQRIALIWRSLLKVGLTPHTDQAGTVSPHWFTLTKCLMVTEYFELKARGGVVSSVQDYLLKEHQFRVKVVTELNRPTKPTLTQAVDTVLYQVGDLWTQLYKSPEGVGSEYPLMVNPLLVDPSALKRGAHQLGGPHGAEPSSKRGRLDVSLFPGVHRASSRAETAGKTVPLKKGNSAFRGKISLTDGSECGVCPEHASGRGCSKWPCTHAHCCDIVANGQPCHGTHSRKNCPHNK